MTKIQRLMAHPIELAVNSIKIQNRTRRLKRFKPLQFGDRFLDSCINIIKKFKGN